MDDGATPDRIKVTADARRLGVSIQIGDVVVTVSGRAPAGMMQQGESQVRAAALRLASRALDVAQQEIASEPA